MSIKDAALTAAWPASFTRPIAFLFCCSRLLAEAGYHNKGVARKQESKATHQMGDGISACP